MRGTVEPHVDRHMDRDNQIFRRIFFSVEVNENRRQGCQVFIEKPHAKNGSHLAVYGWYHGGGKNWKTKTLYRFIR